MVTLSAILRSTGCVVQFPPCNQDHAAGLGFVSRPFGCFAFTCGSLRPEKTFKSILDELQAAAHAVCRARKCSGIWNSAVLHVERAVAHRTQEVGEASIKVSRITVEVERLWLSYHLIKDC